MAEDFFLSEPAIISDLISTWTWFSYYLTCFSAGYFWHDLLDRALNNFSLFWCTTYFAGHNSSKHASGKTFVSSNSVQALSLAVASQKYFGFDVFSLLFEVNSVFLHSRRLLIFHGYHPNQKLYLLNSFVLFFTFVVFRFFSTVWVSYFALMKLKEYSIISFGSVNTSNDFYYWFKHWFISVFMEIT
ncbi:TLC domain-containing protein 2 [Nematostella vectensis]|uniref:TLC domain-containing protein 2 n=1 Tax=Nematostella vectensis TaxID=45351 RepID=UPI0020778580|nr:TLC domain-containing protein 2 [Nematostella vectensis]